MKRLILLITVSIMFSSALFADKITSTLINTCNCDQVIDNKAFKICYDYDMKGAKYVSYSLYANLVNSVNIKKRQRFKYDNRIPRKYRAYYKDYRTRETGYQHGHLAPDASFDYDIRVLKKTYIMSNIIPQVGKINRWTWSKAEKKERQLAVQKRTINVINGVVYSKNPKRIGRHRIAVPIAMWKMIYNYNFKECYYYKNSFAVDTKNDTLQKHRVDCDDLLKKKGNK